MADEVATVETPSMAHSHMSTQWAKVNALLGGTDAMRAAGEHFLPKHAEETQNNWSNRLHRSVLTNLYRRTVRSLSGRPFTEKIRLLNMPPAMVTLAKDVDKQGNNIDVFSRKVFEEGLSHGFSGIFVDFPPQPELNMDGSPRTLADLMREGVSPYFVHIRPENIIAGFAEIINGVEMLTHVRIRENAVEREGFGEVVKERIRVLEPGRWELWEKVKQSNKKEEWKIVNQGETGLAFIPMVIFYTDREGLLVSNPPLMDIADLNIAHWQSASDQRHILTVARFPIFASSGLVDLGTTLIGPNEHLNTPDTQGRFYYVEHSGNAIEAGRKDMEDLKEEMVTLAMEPLLRKAGNVTATQRAIDAAEGHSELQNLAMKFGEVLTMAFTMAAMWAGVEDQITEESEVQLYTEFGPTQQESTDISQLIEMRKTGDISRETFYEELKRRNFVDINFDIKKEEGRLENEPQHMNMLGNPKLVVDNENGDDDGEVETQTSAVAKTTTTEA